MRNLVVTTLSPKADFLSNTERADRHQELMMSPEFREAVKAALLEYAINTAKMGMDSQQVTVGLKIDGAKGFIYELLNLGIPHIPETHRPTAELEPT